MKYFILLFLVIVISGCSHQVIRYHGKPYKIIRAGELYWFAENLATDSFRSGRKIPVVNDNSVWTELVSPACGYYLNKDENLKKYGMFYNWYAVDGGELCPAGWHVSTNDDWVNLEQVLGGHKIAGGKLKAASGWKGSHVGGDDIGFCAMPSGYRLNEDFAEGWRANWWTSTPFDSTWVWGRSLGATSLELDATLNQRVNGFTVRCVRNKPDRK